MTSSTTEERLARVETTQIHIVNSLNKIETTMSDHTVKEMARMEKIFGKLDELSEIAHMGKGAWWMILRIGGFTIAVLAALKGIFLLKDIW